MLGKKQNKTARENVPKQLKLMQSKTQGEGGGGGGGGLASG